MSFLCGPGCDTGTSKLEEGVTVTAYSCSLRTTCTDTIPGGSFIKEASYVLLSVRL